MVPPTICAVAQGATTISMEIRQYRTSRITNSSMIFFGGALEAVSGNNKTRRSEIRLCVDG
jgi:hypothetical protein